MCNCWMSVCHDGTLFNNPDAEVRILQRNANPTEKTLNLDNIERFSDAQIRAAHWILSIVSIEKGLFRVQEFKPISVVPFVKREC